MKGDFTRSTFRPKKHYTSVRMQQGRLQLDSDWNEQADIQNHLRRAQTVDMIGAGSGSASVDLNTGDRNVNGFKVVPIFLHTADEASSSPEDLAILPGHFYANGILCELAQESDFSVSVNSGETQQVAVSSLTIDGRPLAVGQWLIQPEATAASTAEDAATEARATDSDSTDDNNEISSLKGWRISQVDTKNRLLTLEGVIANPETTETLTLRRITTYYTQPDYPLNADLGSFKNQHLLVYLDVWQRHVTAAEDSHIRETALNIPDTTTRTQTVWQLKIEALSSTDNKLKDENINSHWKAFKDQATTRTQTATMTACAKLCDNPKPIQLENRLYRVEIHNPGIIPIPVSAKTKLAEGEKPPSSATFKWSRDNGSIVSKVDSIDTDRSIIRIRQSNQSAWETTAVGQWLELTTEDQELTLEPGILVPFLSATGNQITFDSARITGATALLKNITKVRRWDHTTEQATIPLQTGLVPIEDGIQVRFGQALNSETDTDSPTAQYKTGDYWLIPARSGPQDIEWPNNQADKAPKPLPQAPAGISHAYGLLAVVTTDLQGNLIPKKTSETESETDTGEPNRDRRVVFPPLLYAVDKRGVRGSLSISENLTVGGTITAAKLNIPGVFSAEKFRSDTYELASNPLDGSSPKQGVIQVDTSTPSAPVIKLQAFENSSFSFVDGNVGIGKTSAQHALEVAGTLDASTVLQGGQPLALQNELDLHINTQSNPHRVTAQQIDGNSGQIVSQINSGADAKIQANRIVDAIANHPTATNNPHQINAALIDGNTDEIVKRINVGSVTKISGDRVDLNLSSLTQHIANTANPHNVTADQINGPNADVIVDQINQSNPNARISHEHLDLEVAIHKNKTDNPHEVTAAQIDQGTDEIIKQINAGATEQIDQSRIDGAIARTQNTLSSAGGTLSGDLTVDGNISVLEVGASNFIQLSSQTVKDDISQLSLPEAVTLLAQLNPVKFVYKADSGNRVHAGFIAEETPELLASEDHRAVKILDIVAVVTKAAQHQQGIVSQLVNVAQRQQQEIELLAQKVLRLESNSNGNPGSKDPPNHSSSD